MQDALRKRKEEEEGNTIPDFRLISIQGGRGRISNTVNPDAKESEQYEFHRKGVVSTPKFTGDVHILNDRKYVVNNDGIYDLETGQEVLDDEIVDAIADQLAEDFIETFKFNQKAKELAKGNAKLEEALRIHFAFTGTTNIPNQGDIAA